MWKRGRRPPKRVAQGARGCQLPRLFTCRLAALHHRDSRQQERTQLNRPGELEATSLIQ